MMANGIRACAGLGLLAMCSLLAVAQEKTGQTGDQQFVTEAASGGMFEVRMGKLATENASNEEVRKFGERMINDHGMANKALMEIAVKKGYTVPNTLDEKNQKELAKFAQLKQGEFDREYMKAMVEDH